MLVNRSDDVDRRVLLAERDAARRERIVMELRADLAKMEGKRLKAEMEAAENLRQVGRLEGQLALLFDTPSWRWTAPMRQLESVVDWIRVSLGGLPPVLPSPMHLKPVEAVPVEPLSVREQAILNRLQPAD